MEEKHRNALRTNREALVRDLEASKVASFLYGAEILDVDHKNSIQSKSTPRKQAEALLDILPKRGAKAFNALCDALINISPHLEKLLNPSMQPKQEVLPTERSELVVAMSVESTSTPQVNEKYPITSTDGPTEVLPAESSVIVDAMSVESTSTPQGNEKSPITSTDGPTDDPDGDLSLFNDPKNRMYRMDKTPRGLAVIINNKTFLPESKMHSYPRNGTDVDRDSLKKIFTKFCFTTEVHDNQTVDGFEKIFERLSKRDYSNENALIVCILSHGEEGILHATDGTIQAKDIMKWFKGSNLADKPKIFIFQACQGDDFMDGHDVTDGPQPDECVQIPVESDFLCAYSTVPGYYSWRNPKDGSWFIQSIVKVLEKYGKTTDLLTMMTRVNALVSTYQSRTNHTSTDRKKQVPSIVSMMRKDFYFYPDQITNSNN